MNNAFRRFEQRVSDEAGATSIEYGLVAALIAMTVLGAISATGTSLMSLYVYWSSAAVAAL